MPMLFGRAQNHADGDDNGDDDDGDASFLKIQIANILVVLAFTYDS